MRSSGERSPQTWANRIVPLGADHVMFHLQCVHDGVGDPFAGFVYVLDQAGRDPQACRGRGATPIAQPRLQGPQGLPRPMQTHVAAQPMRNRVPLRAACRIVTHGHAQPQPVAQVALEWFFPQPGTTPMTSPRIRQDQEWPGLGVSRAPDVLPPVRHRHDGKLWRIRRGANRDGTHMARHSVDPSGTARPRASLGKSCTWTSRGR